MNRRQFTGLIASAGAGLAIRRAIERTRLLFNGDSRTNLKFWIWIGNDVNSSVDDWKKRFAVMKDSGIDAILPEIYNSHQAFYESKHLPYSNKWLETIMPIAKAEGLEVHAWMWSMPCNIDDVVTKHPDWYVVNRLGESSTVKPAYVPFYKFLCASHPDACEFVRETVEELSQFDRLDGIHFDYIRYPDVILPKGLQPKYHLIQDRELPQFDYCYCDLCRSDFRKQTGADPKEIPDPSSDTSWLQFRYDRITHLVNDILIPTAKKRGKSVSAAVFPNWKNVRQEWPKWNLNGVLPMLYAGFYDEGVDWIESQTADGVISLDRKLPLYSGLFAPQLSSNDLRNAIRGSIRSGAHGVSLFSSQGMTDDKWSAFKSEVALEDDSR